MEPSGWESEGLRILVRAPNGTPRLWIDDEGDMHDAIGIVRMYGFELYPASMLEAEEIAVFVAEWITCAAEREGAVAIRDVHPELRACVFELTPAAVVVGDEETEELLLS